MQTFLLPLGLAAALLCPFDAQARPDAPVIPHDPPALSLTLDEAQTRAATRSPTLSAARHEVDASAGALRQAGARPNPTLTSTVEDTRRATRTTTTTLDFPVELGGKRGARQAVAERSRLIAEAEVAQARATLTAAVSQAYFTVLIAQHRVVLAARSADLSASHAEATARRVAAGRLPPLDETRARVDDAQAQLEVAEADAELQSARHALAALWGDPQPDFAQVSGDLQVPARPEVAELALQLDDSPQLALARLLADQRGDLAAVERSKATPDLTVSVGARHDNDLGRTQAILAVSVPLPFFDRNQGAVHEAEQRALKARDDERATRLRALNELQAASRQLTTARTSAQLLHDTVLPAAQQAHAGATTAFEAGKFGLLDVLDAQRALLQARTRHLLALSAAHQAAATIDRLLGRQPNPIQP